MDSDASVSTPQDFFFQERVSLSLCSLSWNQLFRTRLASDQHRSACLCLLSAGIKGVCHHYPATPQYFVMRVSKVFSTHTVTINFCTIDNLWILTLNLLFFTFQHIPDNLFHALITYSLTTILKHISLLMFDHYCHSHLWHSVVHGVIYLCGLYIFMGSFFFLQESLLQARVQELDRLSVLSETSQISSHYK